MLTICRRRWTIFVQHILMLIYIYYTYVLYICQVSTTPQSAAGNCFKSTSTLSASHALLASVFILLPRTTPSHNHLTLKQFFQHIQARHLCTTVNHFSCSPTLSPFFSLFFHFLLFYFFIIFISFHCVTFRLQTTFVIFDFRFSFSFSLLTFARRLSLCPHYFRLVYFGSLVILAYLIIIFHVNMKSNKNLRVGMFSLLNYNCIAYLVPLEFNASMLFRYDTLMGVHTVPKYFC